MSGEQIMGVIGFFILVSGALWGIWWRVEGKVKVAEDKGDAAMEKVSDLRLHVAEIYITKAGLRDVKDEIMEALHGVKGSIDHLGGRIDAIYSQGNTPRPRIPK